MFGLQDIPSVISTILILSLSAQALPSNVTRLQARADYVDLPTGWADLGCFVDYSTRILPNYFVSSEKMTPRMCGNLCRSQGYFYAATEYSRQCFCAYEFTTRVPATGCSMTCAGDPAQFCGGSYRAQVFQFTATAAAPVSTPTSTRVSSSPTTTSTVKSTSTIKSTTIVKSTSTLKPTSTVKPTTTAKPLTTTAKPTTTIKPFTSTSKPVTLIVKPSTSTSKVANSTSTSVRPVTTSSARPTSTAPVAPSSSARTTSIVSTSTIRPTSVTPTSTTRATAVVTQVSSSTAKPSSTVAVVTSKVSSSQASSTVRVTSTAAAVPSPTVIANAGVSPKIAISSGEKRVWAHHMVGNTYPYTYDSWVGDINRAKSAGIEGFALNLGPDDWQPSKIADAYAAAQALGGFKMFLSFDMSTFDCVTTARIKFFQDYLDLYLPHPAAATFEGKSILSTFGGEWCTWGQGSGANATNAGWGIVMGDRRNSTYYMPAYTMGDGPRSLSQYDINAELNWGSAWPTGDTDLTTDNDDYWMSFLPNKYVATVAPSFFTHFSYKNWIHRSDNFLFSQRWEMLLAMRNKISQVEIVSWNDYGESHYINIVTGDQPPESKVWTMNPDNDHTPYLTLQAYYSVAWKIGRFPTITSDKVWLTSRPHTRAAIGSADLVDRPTYWDYAEDSFYAQVHLTSPASIILSTDSSSTTFAGQAGINRVAMPLEVGSGIRIRVVRSGSTVINLAPAFKFIDNPVKINHNYLIWQS